MKRRWLLRMMIGIQLGLGAAAAPRLAYAQTGRSALVESAIGYVLAQSSEHPYAAVLDYSTRSNQPRFHVIDRASGTVIHSFIVAHGIGSEPDDMDGVPNIFLDEVDSNASSLGLFKTDEVYMSPTEGNGLSMRLRGLSPTNRNAYKRLIVIHAQSYVEPEMIAALGVAGRSDGCMVFSSADRDTVIQLLRGGALIYAVAAVPGSSAD